MSDEERFTRTWHKRGVPQWRVAELWQKELWRAAEAEKAETASRKRRRQ